MDASAQAGNTARALVVEDHPETRRFLKASLRHIGFEVAEASNASEAQTLAECFQPHIVTLDLIMPRVGGVTSLDLLKKIREVRPQSSVFVVSGVISHDEREKYLRAGARGFFLKPVLRADQFETLFQEAQIVRAKVGV